MSDDPNDQIITDMLIQEREKQRYHNWPTVDSQVPIIMDNGFMIERPMFDCVSCKMPLLYGENLHGEFRVVPGGDLRLTGYGYCPRCHVLSTIRQHYLQQQDGTVEIKLILRPNPIPLYGAEIIPFDQIKRKRRKNKDGKKD